MSKLNINFNNINLSNYCKILNISDMLLPPRINNSKSVSVMNGSYYTGFKYGERTVDVEILINGDTEEELKSNIKELGNILNTKTPVKMITSKYPVDGDTSLNYVNRLNRTGIIKFICNNPIIYSDDWNSYCPNNRGIITLENSTNLEANPSFSINFNNDSCFAQITNVDGQTVLVGRPKDLAEPVLAYPLTFEDFCENPANFQSLSDALLPQGHVGGGVFSNVNAIGQGTGMGCDNYGSGDGWHGASARRMLPREFEQFELCFEFIFSSDDWRYSPPIEQPLPPTAPPPSQDNPSTTCFGTYEVSAKSGLWIREQPNTNCKRWYAMTYKTKVYPTKIENGWAYHSVSANGKEYTGWSSMQHLNKISDSGRRLRNDETIESQVGTLQFYGFEKNGSKLFDFRVMDTSEYFENATPMVWIEGNQVLNEDAISGRPINTISTDENGGWEYVASGAVGRWNNCHGRLFIRREKDYNGNYLWTATLHKYKDWGTIIETMTMPNAMVSSKKNALSYLGLYVGALGNFTPKKYMILENIKVTDLVTQENISNKVNIPLFRAGDVLNIDFEEGTVTCNGQDIIDKVDIGSEFFNIPQGETKVIVRTDDQDQQVLAGVRNLYI